VRACLVYRDKEGREIGSGISLACWLGDPPGDIVDFPVGQTHCVILAILETNGQLVNPYRKRTRSSWGDGLGTEFYELNTDLKSIELRILSGDDLLAEPIYLEFDISDGRPTAVPR